MEPDFSAVVWAVLGAALGVLVLYFTIRLAVRHAIRDVRELDAQDAARDAREGD